ncbi:serine-rich adhesin for platelets-like isoform X2 [Helicoverpa zea]|uniref:serine-rich adhesin for platelets-like isoform X2 n=1 Tax=Helicoverpa zea TaxID=7113 RepID=UPI001F58F80B|nr:serine-rich adhesin for platelets-like isoform X2 [Helicoverpa zea]
MKFKVILFCVLLFCSKFVDSVPHSEELVRQRAFQPTNWPANKYAAGQYVDANFAQTQNENVLKNSGLQLENNQEYFANQGTRGFGNQGFNKGLSSSLIGKERLLNYAPSVEEERVNSYPIRSHSYQSNAPQIGLDNQQFGYQNWRAQNQYNAANVQEVIPNNDRPLVTTVQEPYRGPVQYVKPQFIAPVNRRHYSVNRYYPAREQLQYPIDNIGLPSSVSTKYVQNSAPISVVRESVPYDNYGNGQGTASNNNAGVIASKQFYDSESASPYNGAPDVISSEVLPEESGNSSYEVIQNPQADSGNAADVTTINNNFQDVPVADSYNTDNRPSTLVPVDNKAEAASIIQKVLADKPLVRRYSHNYRPGTNYNNYAREGTYNGASVGQTNTYGINSGNVNNNYGSGLVPNKQSPVNTYSKAAQSASSHVDAALNLGHKNTEAVPQYTSTTTAPVATTNSENDFYRQLTSGIHQYDLKNIASHPKIKDLLAVNNKPYVLIHANGSVEYFDKFDLDAKENSKYRLIHTKHTPLGKPQNVQSDKVLKPQPPALVPTSTTTPALVPITSATPALLPTSTTTPAPSQLVNGGVSKPLPSSNEWADDDSSYVNQPADDKTSQLSPLYRKHHGIDNYSTSPHPHVKLPADDDDSKPTISSVNKPQDDTTKPLVSTESQSSVSESKSVSGDHPDKNVNNKSTTSDDGLISDDVKQPDDDSTPKPLVSKDGQSSITDDSKSVVTGANQSDKSNNDNNDTKPLPDNVNQPDDVSTPKPLPSHNDKPSSGDNDDDSSLAPNVQQPDDNSTPKPGAPKKTSVATVDNSEQVSSKVNKSDNNDSNNSQPLKENQPVNDDSSSTPSVDLPNDSTPKPLSPKDNQSPNHDDSKSLSSDDNKSGNGDDNKPQKPSAKDNQPSDSSSTSDKKDNPSPIIRDDFNSSPSEVIQPHDGSDSSANDKNQSSPKNDSQSPNLDDSNSSLSNLDQSDDDSNSNANENSSITDNSPTSTTPSSVVSDQNTSPAPVVQSTPSNKDDSVSSTTASSDVTTPSADTTTEDEIITISPIEQATDNVSDAPATTTTKPTYTHPRFHIGTPKSDKKDIAQDDKTVSSSVTDKKQISTQESQSSTVSQSDSTSDSNQNVIQKNTEQEHSESTVSQTRTTKNNSNTGDADRDDKSVVIKVKTDDNDSADSKTSNASDCEKNKTSKDENTNQNLEIDMATIEGEPTMWIRTTNQDFVEKLASKNDTQFDVIYFFNMNPQPTIEREKVTTIHCNGTVVIEKTETSYASQDDKTPKIVKTTTVLQIEDYKP